MLFDNCLIKAPDDTPLSRCNLKKVKYYLDNELADIVSDNPITIRLRFEPSGRLEDPVLLAGKPNICAVCGIDENLTKHHIIPVSFIKHMDVIYKIDMLKDIIALCQKCHIDYERHSDEKRYNLAKDITVDFGRFQMKDANKIQYLRGPINSLHLHRNKIPIDKAEMLLQRIKNTLDFQDVSYDDLESMFYVIKKFVFSKYIVENTTDFNLFARDWRNHFVQTMNPQFMPETWDVNREFCKSWIPKRWLRKLTNA